jgi:hypothetical protein
MTHVRNCNGDCEGATFNCATCKRDVPICRGADDARPDDCDECWGKNHTTQETIHLPCTGCALTDGAAANCEPENNLKAMLCVLGGVPFYCHVGMDWQTDESHKRTRRQAISLGIRPPVCAGWKREVAALARTGYYRDRAPLKREFAILGLANLQTYVDASADSQEKQDALQVLGSVLEVLTDEQAKFLPVVEGSK